MERRDGGEARQASGEKAQRVDVVGVADGAGHVSLRSIFQPIFFFLFSISYKIWREWKKFNEKKN